MGLTGISIIIKIWKWLIQLSATRLVIIHKKKNRSLISRLRAGCLDFGIGRWRGVNKDERICTLCNDEIEIHFLFHCCKLEHIRTLYSDINDRDSQSKILVLFYFLSKSMF